MDGTRTGNETAQRGPTGIDAAGTASREQLLEQVRWALERAVPSGSRVAVIMVHIDTNYANKAHERVHALLEGWRQHRAERVQSVHLAIHRFALIVAPIGHPAHARALAEELTRSLDPRICPLLRRALPYACFGLGLYPDDGLDAESLLVRAGQALERMRTAGSSCRKLVPGRRRHAGANPLQPEGVR